MISNRSYSLQIFTLFERCFPSVLRLYRPSLLIDKLTVTNAKWAKQLNQDRHAIHTQ